MWMCSFQTISPTNHETSSIPVSMMVVLVLVLVLWFKVVVVD